MNHTFPRNSTTFLARRKAGESLIYKKFVRVQVILIFHISFPQGSNSMFFQKGGWHNFFNMYHWMDSVWGVIYCQTFDVYWRPVNNGWVSDWVLASTKDGGHLTKRWAFIELPFFLNFWPASGKLVNQKFDWEIKSSKNIR